MAFGKKGLGELQWVNWTVELWELTGLVRSMGTERRGRASGREKVLGTRIIGGRITSLAQQLQGERALPEFEKNRRNFFWSPVGGELRTPDSERKRTDHVSKGTRGGGKVNKSTFDIPEV